ncbi:MAG: hypothetical protein ACOXZV_09905 [Bacteroidales bacterium]|jgi:hypothetical protein
MKAAFMIPGQSSAAIAVLALDKMQPLHDVPNNKLVDDDQILENLKE